MLFKLNNISKHYGSESEGTLRKVLDGLTLEINEGESIAILGPSGTGKTTLLNIMGTLDRPDSGDLFYRESKIVPKEIDFEMEDDTITNPVKSDGKSNEKAQTELSENISSEDRKSELRASHTRPIVKIQPHTTKTEKPESDNLFSTKENLVNYTTKQLDTFRNEKIGFVFQMHHLLPQCTLLENILIPTLTINDKKVKVEKASYAKELMQRVGIWEQRDQMPGHLSGGECQRAAVVRALINKPGLLLADEPTGALDEDNVSKLALLLLEINKSLGVTLVVVTHSLALASKMNTVYELRNGKLRLKILKA
jgi:ABC-type lipoprotein export system ATPase subunit